MRISIGLLCVPMFAGILNARDLQKDIAACSAMKGDLDRLQCFDSLSQSLGLDRSRVIKNTPVHAGKWSVQVDKNPIDDTETAVAILDAGSGKSKMGDAISLVLRCQSNNLEAYIDWNDFLGSNGADVTIRFGTNTAVTDYWSLSSNHTASFYHGDVSSFLNQLAAVKSFIAQVTPYDENPVTAMFDTTGAENAIKPILETCYRIAPSGKKPEQAALSKPGPKSGGSTEEITYLKYLSDAQKENAALEHAGQQPKTIMSFEDWHKMEKSRK